MFNNLFSNNPDMTADGIPPLTLVGAINYVNDKPDLETARYDARQAAGIKMYPLTNRPFRDARGLIQLVHSPQYLVIDQEAGLDLSTDRGRKDMLAAIAAIRDEWASYPDHPELKNLKIGIFGQVPAGVPNLIQLDDPAALDKFAADTDAQNELSQALDFVCPALYLDTTDQNEFVGRMSLQIRYARRVHKPVYPYIWPEFFEQVQSVPMHELIPKDQWQAILDEARNEADGVIIWGGVHRFDPNLPWAKITRNYLKLKPLPPPETPSHFQVDPIGLHLSWQGVASTSRVRIERTLDAGKHWRPLAGTDPGAANFDDPEYLTSPAGFTPQYRIQAYNPFGSSDYAYSPVIHPARDAFAVNRGIWYDAIHPRPNREYVALANLYPNTWVEFKNMAFRQNADHINLLWRSESNLDIWLDCKVNSDSSLDFSHATKAGSIRGRRYSQPGGDPPVISWEQSAPVSVPGGPNVTHDVFLVSTDGGVYLMWAKFGGANDPSAPPRHFAAAGQGGKILLTWFDQADDETAFQIERSPDLGMTWTKLPNIPAITPDHPDESNSLESCTIPATDDAMYTYRISSLHGAGVAPDIFTDIATGSSKRRPFAVAFSAKSYDRALALHDDPHFPDQLFHIEFSEPATHDSEKIQRYAWMKYSADFGTAADRITINLSTEGMVPPNQTISFYIDRLAPDHKLASWTPCWTGTGGNYEAQTLAIPLTSGVHDLYMQLDDPFGISIKTIRIDKTTPVPDLSIIPARDPNNVRLSWQAASDEVNGYIIQFREVIQMPKPTPSDYIKWVSHPIPFKTHSLDLAGLKRNTDYEFCVIARTKSGPRPSVLVKYHTPP
jgi:Fibronectin type III domain